MDLSYSLLLKPQRTKFVCFIVLFLLFSVYLIILTPSLKIKKIEFCSNLSNDFQSLSNAFKRLNQTEKGIFLTNVNSLLNNYSELIIQDLLSSICQKVSVHQTEQPASPPSHNSSKKSPILIKDLYTPGFHIRNPNFCPEEGKSMKLLILVSSKADNFDTRLAIRRTYGHFNQRSDVGIAFVVAESQQVAVNEAILQEQDLYGDLIQACYIDAYRNHTLKLVAMLEWVDNHCSRVPFIMKIDDDAVLNVASVLVMLQKLPAKRSIFGYVNRGNVPIRNPKSKWYTTYEEYAPDVYPDHMVGVGYFITGDVIRELYRAALPSVYMLAEDALITGVLPHKLSIQLVHLEHYIGKDGQPCINSHHLIMLDKDIHKFFIVWQKMHAPKLANCTDLPVHNI